MSRYNEVGVMQRTMAIMAEVAQSSICRLIASKNIQPISSPAQRKLRYSIEDTRTILSSFSSMPILKQTQSFYNFKGGTGKTSLCFQVATHMALLGYRVLVVDADPQGHLSTTLGFKNDENYLTLFDVISGKISVLDVIHSVYPGLDCIPANLSLTRLEVILNQLPKREEQITMALSPYKKDYDFIFFDTNPTISHLNRNIMTFCERINIVCETQPYSLNGLKLLIDDMHQFYDSMQMALPSIFIIPNKYEDRTSSSAEAMTALRQYYRPYLKQDFAIRKCEDINISAKTGMPLAFFAKNTSKAFEDIMELLHYILQESKQKLDKAS